MANSYQHVLSQGIKLARLKAGLVPSKQCSVLLIELRAAVLSCWDLLKYSHASKTKQSSTSIFWGEEVGSVAFSCHLVGRVIQNPHTLDMAQVENLSPRKEILVTQKSQSPPVLIWLHDILKEL